MEQKLCIHCHEKIPMQANKCKHCHEFQSELDNGNTEKNIEIIKGWFTLAGKSLIPILILTIIIIFKPTLEEMISKTIELELMGNKFKLVSSGFSGELSAYELYYLIDSADHTPDYDGGLNYDLIKESPSKFNAITSLEEKGLITIKIEKFDGNNPEIFGQKTLKTFKTKKGEDLLRQLGIKF